MQDFREHLTEWQSVLKSFALSAATKHHPGKETINQIISKIGKQLVIIDPFEFIEALLSAKDDWLNLAEDIHDISSFYKTQITIWRRMLEGLQRFEPNRPALIKESVAVNALQQLETIRDNLTPYAQINQIEALIQSVEAVNEKLVESKREHALVLMEKKIAEVAQALDQAHAPADLRNRALLSLQQIKLDIAGLTSIPQIHYLQEQSGTALDSAMDIITAAVSAAAKPQPHAAKAPGDSSTVTNIDAAQPAQTVAPKPARVIRAADLSSKLYLETEAEVDDYLAKLKA